MHIDQKNYWNPTIISRVVQKKGFFLVLKKKYNLKPKQSED